MAIRELWYGEHGPIIFDDAGTDWYPDAKPTRGARTSQAYIEDAPVDDMEIVRLADLQTVTWPRLFMLMGA